MRKIFFTLLTLIIFFTAENFVQAADDKLRDEKIHLACALSAFSVCGNEENFFALSTLNAQGWKIDAITEVKNRVDTKGYLLSRENDDGQLIKILVIIGTEEMKDAEVNSRSFANKFLSNGVADFLIDDMKKNPSEILYITGHNFGGAVALLTAIRLADMGADANKIKVVTFGAPAIADREFADAYKNKIDWTQIVIGESAIRNSSVGKIIKYTPVRQHEHDSQDMAVYLDCAIRNYFNAGGFNEPLADKVNAIKNSVYVAPIKIVEKSFTQEDEKYICAILTDSLSVRSTNLIFANPQFEKIKKDKNFSYDVSKFIAPAKKAGCKYILAQMIKANVVKESRQRQTRVTIEQVICDLDGYPLSIQTAGATTKNFTLIEAAAFAQESLRENREKI